MANPPSSPQFDWKMYRYIPSLAGAAIAMTIFLILTLLHIWKYFTTRSHLLIYVILGALCEVAGFAARIGSHHDNTSWAPFITQGTLLLIGPLFFAATTYMMLGRTIRLAGGEAISFIRPVSYTRIFVGADITTMCIQGLGAGIMGTMNLSLALAGEKVVIAGLALQVATFIVFLAACIDFHIRMNSSIISNTSSSSSSSSTSTDPSTWRRTMRTLYALSGLILFRCVFRLIEYAMGNAAYLIAHEWTLYVFDAVPMTLVLVLFWGLRGAEDAKVGEDREKVEGEASVCEVGVGRV